MDFTSSKMSHGEPQWDTKYNGLVDKLNNNLGGVNLSLSSASSEGLVFQNGASNQHTWYRYIELNNGRKLVELSISFGHQFKLEAWKWIDIITLPTAIMAPENQIIRMDAGDLHVELHKDHLSLVSEADLNENKLENTSGHCMYYTGN